MTISVDDVGDRLGELAGWLEDVAVSLGDLAVPVEITLKTDKPKVTVANTVLTMTMTFHLLPFTMLDDDVVGFALNKHTEHNRYETTTRDI